ncbi:MAG: hypothetical protein GX434_12250 [Peptococcaceae bacterium]|nr:hypothetical protein [Peptococcaceae bacterium]
MKGVIVGCISSIVKEKFGNETWGETLTGAGLSQGKTYLAGMDVDDNEVMEIIKSLCKLKNMTLEQVSDLFGDYWVNVYCPKIYGVYYRNITSAREFLLKLDEIHNKVTKNVQNAAPPRFNYTLKDENTLIMEYKSLRGLIVFFISLAKAVGKYFKEDITVKKLESNKIEINFKG